MTSSCDQPGDDPRARLFVAVTPPAVVLDRLERWLERIRSAWTSGGGSGSAGGGGAVGESGDGLRWTGRAQWHVTLRFLGDAPVGAASAALDAVVADAADAEVGPRLRQLGRGVLCLPVGGLEDLAGAVASATGAVGRTPERRRFRGHLTLARARAGRRAPSLGGLLAASSAEPLDERFRVGEILLVRSTLRPTGAVYDVVARRPLRR